MNRFIKIIIALAILSSLSYFSLAQKKPQLNIIGRVISGNGLMTDWIQYIKKDSHGFIWLTFDDGFNRWDGYDAKRFPAFLADTTLNSSNRFCRPILEDREGNFFIGTLANGLIKLDRNTDEYLRYVNDPNNPETIAGDSIHELMLDGDGKIWIGSYNDGLSCFEPGTGVFKNYKINKQIAKSSNSNDIRSMYRDSQGVFWIGTGDGLFQFDEVNNLFKSISLDPEFLKHTVVFECMIEDRNGNMWFGTRNGLVKYNRNKEAWEHIITDNPDKPDSRHDAYLHCLAEYHHESKHQIWIGTEAGLKVYCVNTRVVTHFNSKNGYPVVTNTGPVQYLYIDDQDILWAALEGLTLIDLKEIPYQVFPLPSFPDSIENVPASCFYEDENNNLWVGTLFDGLYKYDDKLDFVENFQSITQDPSIVGKGLENGFQQIYKDYNKRLWMLIGPTGLSLFDKKSGKFIPVEMNIGLIRPKEILEDNYGNYWLAANNGLIGARYNGNHVLTCSYVNEPVLSSASIHDIHLDKENRLWVITNSKGVWCLDQSATNSMGFRQYLHNNYQFDFTDEFNAKSMLEGDNGMIWFRSEREFFRYHQPSDSIIPVDHFNDFNDRKIFSFTRDHNGIFWFIWRYGLIYYNPNDSTQDNKFVMTMYDGLPFTYLMRNSFFFDNRGYLYCGGQATINRGFFRFHPDSIRGPNRSIPPIALTDFRYRNQKMPLDSNVSYIRELELNYTQNFFTFQFSAMDYRTPLANQYSYMLEGLDEDWVYNGSSRVANYTGVPPGKYIFRVKGTNNHGYWNEEGTSIRIIIHPPPWRTWWAYTLYGIGLSALFLALRFYDLKRQRLKQSLELEQVEKNKLGELNRLKSRFFANISHEFRTPLTLILGPLDKLIARTPDEDCQKDLGVMRRNAHRLQELINQLLSISKLESGHEHLQASELDIVQLTKWYTQSFESLAKQKNIKLRFESEKDRIMLWADQDKVEKILYNLLSNAFKFTGSGGNIMVEVDSRQLTVDKKDIVNRQLACPELVEGSTVNLPEKCIVISVSDTGSGIPEDQLPHIFDRFYQADNGYKADSEGTGIGLALAKELVELHHGHIEVSSEIGVGSRFDVFLPLGDEHLSDEVKTQNAERNAQGDVSYSEPLSTDNRQLTTDNRQLTTDNRQLTTDNRQLTTDITSDKPIILIVEDNADMRAYIRDYLEDEYQVIEAVDGEVGLENAIAHIPDLVISDVMMPRMDGYEFCKALKLDERTSHIPVIILTAKASQESKMEGLETGADDFMVKPFEADELMLRVRNIIEQRRRWRQQFQKKFSRSDFTPFPQLLENSINTTDEQFLQKGFQVVEKHLDDAGYSVEEFMIDMAMSKVQLYRKLKGLLNLSALEFIRSIRLSHAARMIKEKTDNIAQIAYAVGFNNPSYFAECFKRQFGKSPSEYAKM